PAAHASPRRTKCISRHHTPNGNWAIGEIGESGSDGVYCAFGSRLQVASGGLPDAPCLPAPSASHCSTDVKSSLARSACSRAVGCSTSQNKCWSGFEHSTPDGFGFTKPE